MDTNVSRSRVHSQPKKRSAGILGASWSIVEVVSALLFPVGAVFWWLARPLFTGAEELTRWDTIIFSNKNALFFLVLIGIGLVGSLYANQRKGWMSWAIMGATAGVIALFAWMMGGIVPFDIAAGR